MLSLISNKPADRASLSAWRSVGSIGGNMLPMVILPFIIYDANDNLIGERVFIAALIMGVLGFIFFQFMIRNTEIREDSEASCAHIKEVVMKNITTRKTVRRTLGWVSALAAVLVLSVLVLAGTGDRDGVALLDGMTAEEEAQFRSDHELGFADSSVSADGTVRYYDIHGNVIFEGTKKEAAPLGGLEEALMEKYRQLTPDQQKQADLYLEQYI